MKNKTIEKYLNYNFVNGECMEFLVSHLSKYEDIYNLINWTNCNYNITINGVSINYEYDEDIKVTVRVNNYYKGSLTITVSKYHNNVKIIDNLSSYNAPTDITTVAELSAYKDGNSIVSFNKYKNYEKKYQKLVYGSKLKFSSNGNMIDYKEYEEDINKNNMKQKTR